MLVPTVAHGINGIVAARLVFPCLSRIGVERTVVDDDIAIEVAAVFCRSPSHRCSYTCIRDIGIGNRHRNGKFAVADSHSSDVEHIFAFVANGRMKTIASAIEDSLTVRSTDVDGGSTEFSTYNRHLQKCIGMAAVGPNIIEGQTCAGVRISIRTAGIYNLGTRTNSKRSRRKLDHRLEYSTEVGYHIMYIRIRAEAACQHIHLIAHIRESCFGTTCYGIFAFAVNVQIESL